MEEFTRLIVWLVAYSVSGGFWHFVACLLIIRAITGFTTLFRFHYNGPKTQIKADKKTDEE